MHIAIGEEKVHIRRGRPAISNNHRLFSMLKPDNQELYVPTKDFYPLF